MLRGDLFQNTFIILQSMFLLLDKDERRVHHDIVETQDIDGGGTDNNQLMPVIKHQ